MEITHQMTKGTPGKLIIKFALPLMAGNLCQQLYIMVDTIIVGQVLGVLAIGAVGATEWIVWMLQGLVQGFAQGFSIKMAQDFGAKNYSSLRKVVYHATLLAVIITLILVVISFVLANNLLNLLNTPANVLDNAVIYLKTMIIALPVVMAYNLLAAILRSFGNSKTPLYAMLVASVINIVLDIVFVYYLNMGVFGAAFATMIAQVFSALFCLRKILQLSFLKINKDEREFSRSLSIYLMKLGLPMAFQNMVISIGGMILQTVINGFGVVFLAGFTATNKLYGLLEVAATSYGYAMVTYVGQNAGANQIERIKQGYKSALLIAIVTSIIIGVVMIVFGRWILLMFINGEDQLVNATLDVAYRYLFIMSLFLTVLYYLHITRSSIQGLGNTVLPMCSGIIEFVMRTATALLLSLLMGSNGIFFAEIAAWLGADIVLFFSYRYCLKNLCNPLE
ncbi:MATE family efflux transporter [uncultured Thomasclavelia sp.]|uniref:MATE family efflux transporter n=1 Tax=uncultured Thomasclavelia sp. TaxID=3025759 RepID=UPI0025DB3A79|nr:MATE family efflux transporter [uncultured Thomasclavelia sp.]